MITQELLKELLHYNPETGVFTWRERDRRHFKSAGRWKSWNASLSGSAAGFLGSNGYVRISIFGKECLGHRLAFLWMEGNLPENHADHINGLPSDNRWVNLRRVTPSENARNAKLSTRNTSGIIGVSWYKRHKAWKVSIVIKGREVNLGYYSTKESAARVRKNAEKDNGYHSNHGRAQV